LIDLALDAGFSSKSSFNAIFKKLTGQTPSLYRRQPISQ
jgi:AraC-like DNA-binding protein